MTPAYEEGLRLGIERAGYVPVRVDRTEHVNRIDDEISADEKTQMSRESGDLHLS